MTEDEWRKRTLERFDHLEKHISVVQHHLIVYSNLIFDILFKLKNENNTTIEIDAAMVDLHDAMEIGNE